MNRLAWPALKRDPACSQSISQASTDGIISSHCDSPSEYSPRHPGVKRRRQTLRQSENRDDSLGYGFSKPLLLAVGSGRQRIFFKPAVVA
jgi:hypothetical protein